VSVAVDGQGHSFVGGFFDFDLIIGATTHDSLGFSDMFVAKLDAAGNRIWSRSFGSIWGDELGELAVDEEGNVVVAASIADPVSFDGGTTTLPFAGVLDIVIVKLSGDDGGLIWARSFGAGLADEARGIAIDEAGNVIVSGLFRGSVPFGATTLTATGADAFLVKLDESGEVLWARQMSGSGSEVGRALDAGPGGDLLLAGDYDGTLGFGGHRLPASTDAQTDVFVARLDAQGDLRWLRSLSGAQAQEAHEIAFDPWDNALLGGSLRGEVELAGETLSSAGGADAYLVKLSSTGTWLWGERFGDGADQSLDGVAVDETGNAVGAGWFFGVIDFGDGNPHTSAGLADVFLMTRAP
jgi:hypothetical protein